MAGACATCASATRAVLIRNLGQSGRSAAKAEAPGSQLQVQYSYNDGERRVGEHAQSGFFSGAAGPSPPLFLSTRCPTEVVARLRTGARLTYEIITSENRGCFL